MKGTDIYIGSAELERKKTSMKKLAIIWSCYGLIAAGLVYLVLWTGFWR